ncbi:MULTISPECIES: DUF6171 family protein [unclassified Butyrivibrio]|uniref:DUF6171 family protein n=1 Tax=unclassified Butyrivibrio TaxID=2639466 RepID=UPI000416725E|nr:MULTISPECIES: DUF6171 family protein [unclassified Butyrivibrio]
MDTRVCRHCLLRDLEGDEKEMIQKYRDAIDPEDRVSEAVYESRLKVCTECDKLSSGTCLACGCYVELRALGIVSRCPKKKW